MPTNTQGRSATIYQFPVRGRFATNMQRDDTTFAVSVSTRPVVSDSGWYHDEAIRDSERPRKN